MKCWRMRICKGLRGRGLASCVQRESCGDYILAGHFLQTSIVLKGAWDAKGCVTDT